jgi:hypothetical protein
VRLEPHGAGMDGLLQLRLGIESAMRRSRRTCTVRSVAFFAAGTESPGLVSGSSPPSVCLGNWMGARSKLLLTGAVRMPPCESRARGG